jgi:hypothetical protein
MSISKSCLSLLATVAVCAATAMPAAAGVVSQAYYVSPNGSDKNNGLTSAKPFQTLEMAEWWMANSKIKTTYLMGGVYKRTAPLNLRTNDAGESWLAYPGQTPVLDGGGTTADAFAITSSNITIRWLTIQNFALEGVYGQYVSNIVLDSNTITNINSNNWNQGGIVLQYNVVGATVTHNTIKNSRYAGVLVVDGPGNVISGVNIAYNNIQSTCTAVADCGAIQMDNRSHGSSPSIINNNVIGNYGSAATLANAIYLDDLLSYATVTNNIVYGSGNYGMLIHASDHNTVSNNIFDISGSTAFIQYSNWAYTSYPMNNNVVSCNIVYSSHTPPLALWSKVGNETNPTVSQNLYWDTTGRLPNIGAIVDAQPTVANPQFVNTAAGNYNFSSGRAPSFCNFKPISTTTVGPVPNT